MGKGPKETRNPEGFVSHITASILRKIRMHLEQKRWAGALATERQYGDKGPFHITTRIGELASAGDEAGVERWLAHSNAPRSTGAGV
jgi:hypothetical protein